MTVRTRIVLFRVVPLLSSASLLFFLAAHLVGQNATAALTVLARDARRAIPITTSGGQEMVALDDLTSLFQLAVREERDALTVSYKGRTVVLTPDQAMASVSGRLIALPAPPVKVSNRWLVPLEFISRALLPIYDARLELRRPSHLLIVGDLRVPRVTIRPESIGSSVRVTIESTPRAATNVSQDGPSRLLVKFDADAIDVQLPTDVVPGIVLAYRTVDATSVAIELGPRFESFRSSTQIVDAATRLILELQSGGTEPAVPATTEAEPPREAPPLVPSAAVFRTIAVDAGHGGDDVGVKGAGGTTEKDLTLALARRLRAAVEARLGLRVVMTRDDDRSVAVTDRTALANNNKASLFLSLHVNGSFRSNVAGAAVYVASFDDTALTANPLRPERLAVFGGGTRDIELVPWNLAQIRHRERSDVFAEFIMEGLKGRIPLGPRPIEHAPLRVLESANMPAVLVEAGYLTNADQEKQIVRGDFQQPLIEALIDAIVRFRDATSGSEGPGR